MRASRLVLPMLLALAACSLRTSYSLRDTEGSEYRASCTASDCAAVVESPRVAAPSGGCAAGSRPVFALAGQRVVVACHACVGAGAPGVDPERCRALVCQTDRDCPPYHRGAATRCLRGLCQVPTARELDLPAAAALCMAGAGPSGTTRAAESAERMALAQAACTPNGCTAPTACRALE
jgi:hypothetical protein